MQNGERGMCIHMHIYIYIYIYKYASQKHVESVVRGCNIPKFGARRWSSGSIHVVRPATLQAELRYVRDGSCGRRSVGTPDVKDSFRPKPFRWDEIHTKPRQ